ncbi:peptidase [Streptococcus sp. sy004]|nr:peptidase [Streptococcus sp. sy018]TWT12137.1 peptidase [Streptococcus sp. sy004]
MSINHKKERKTMDRTIPLYKQYLFGFVLLLFSLFFAVMIMAYWAMRPHLLASQQARQVAQEVAQLKQTNQVERYSGEMTYYTIYGQTQDDQEVIVTINQETGQVYMVPQSTGLSKEEAVAKAQDYGAGTIDKAVFGRYQERSIWEVKSDKAYYLIDFTSGELVKKEGL